MDSPWRWTLYFIFIILSHSNVAVFGQDLTSATTVSEPPMRNREYVQTNTGPPPQVIQPISNVAQIIGEYPNIPPGRIAGLENQQIFLLPDGIPPPLSLNILPLHLTSPPCQQSPPLMPVTQYNIPLQSSNPPLTFPFISTSVIPSGTVSAPNVPTPALTLSSSQLTPLISSTELSSIYCPPFTSSKPCRLVPLFQQQVPVDGFQPSLPLPDTGPQSNFQYLNYPPAPTASSLRIVPLSQSQVFPLENCMPFQIVPDYLPPSNIQLPIQNYPLVPQYEPARAPYVQSMPMLPEENFPTGAFPNINLNPPFYQVASLPPVLPTVPFISEPSTYSSNQFINTFKVPSTDNVGNSQLPITLQINMPESPTPIISVTSPVPPYANEIPPSVPPFGMSPIVIGKSKSRWKNWLPAFILALFANNRGDFGCDGCGSCCYFCRNPNPAPENVYIPYPIPISTNNPIILNKRSSGKGRGCDKCDKEVNAD